MSLFNIWTVDNMEEQTSQSHISILQSLANIQQNLAVNTTETKNIKDGVGEIKNDVREVKEKVAFQNGRVRTLEDWSIDAKKLIESNTKTASETLANYKNDRTKILAGAAVFLFVGGVIVTLSVMAINSKIRDGINEALSAYSIEHETE